jgi:hypothetical protein
MEINLWDRDKMFVFSERGSALTTYTTIVVTEKTNRKSYIGQNAYGARAKVSSTVVHEFGLVLANIKPDPESAVFSLSLPVKPHLAKSLKKDLAFYVDIELTRSNTLKDIILTHVFGQSATVDIPLEIYVSGEYVLANLKEIGVYRKSTGEVLGWKKF